MARLHGNEAYSRYHSAPKFHVRLTCGCTIKLRMSPPREETKLGCLNGLGHGYSLGWVEWTDTGSGHQIINRKLATS